MRRRPLGNSVPVAINRYINSAYDNVLLVAENLEAINTAAENIEFLSSYLGAFDDGDIPTERPDGTPLETGDFYYSDKATYYYNADDETWTEFNPEELLAASVAAVAAAARAEEARDIAVDAEEKAFSLVGGTDIGDYEDDPTFNNITDYVVFGRGTSEIALFKVEENVDLPYTVDSVANTHPTDDDNLRAYTSTATLYTYEETTYLTDGQVVVDATSELKNYVVYLWDAASGERERLDVVYDYTTNNSNQIVLTDTYPVGSIVTIVFEDIGQNSDTYLKKQEAEQKYGDHNKQANRGSENSHPASAISTTSGESVQTMVAAIKGKNELNNSNFLIPSPDDITHPSSVATSYNAGIQIFSGVYAGEDGCTVTYINGQVTCTAGSYEYRVPNTNGLEYVPTLSSSVASYDGLPKQVGVGHALVIDDYVVTVTPEAGSVFTVKFEQGSVATGHEVKSESKTVRYENIDNLITGMPYAATVGDVVEVDLMKFKIEPVSSGSYGVSINAGLYTAVLTSGFVTYEAFGADPSGVNVSSVAMQNAIDFLRKRPPLAGNNFDLTYASRGVIEGKGDAKYRIDRPLLLEEDVVNQYFATGITVNPNGSTIIVDDSFAPAQRVKNTGGTIVNINSALIVGVKDYATQSGRYVSFIRWDNQKIDGSGIVESALYEDLSSHNFFDKWVVNNCDYGLTGKVAFLNSYSSWKLYNCNGTISWNNTSVVDGYNSGNGLEGGGITLGDWTITGDNGGTQPRFSARKIGEFKFTSFTSYQGLGDGLVVERNPTDSATGSRWNQFGVVEIGDLAGSPIVFSYASFIQVDQYICVKNGQNLTTPGDALHKITNCADITISGVDVDQFYDFGNSTEWGSVAKIHNSNRVKFELNNCRAIPLTDNAYDMFEFTGTSSDCSVKYGVLNQAPYTKLYKSPVSSEATCKNIKVRFITTRGGAFVSTLPELKGDGDLWDQVTNAEGGYPLEGAKESLPITASGSTEANYRKVSIVKPVSDNVSTKVLDVNFLGSVVHNAVIDVVLSVVGDSGNASRATRSKFMFTRTAAGGFDVQFVNLTGEDLNYSASANYTVDSLVMTSDQSQFSLTINTTANFGGSIGDASGVMTADVSVSSKSGFEVVR